MIADARTDFPHPAYQNLSVIAHVLGKRGTYVSHSNTVLPNLDSATSSDIRMMQAPTSMCLHGAWILGRGAYSRHQLLTETLRVERVGLLFDKN
jgi:hypothetical protein